MTRARVCDWNIQSILVQASWEEVTQVKWPRRGSEIIWRSQTRIRRSLRPHSSYAGLEVISYCDWVVEESAAVVIEVGATIMVFGGGLKSRTTESREKALSMSKVFSFQM